MSSYSIPTTYINWQVAKYTILVHQVPGSSFKNFYLSYMIITTNLQSTFYRAFDYFSLCIPTFHNLGTHSYRTNVRLCLYNLASHIYNNVEGSSCYVSLLWITNVVNCWGLFARPRRDLPFKLDVEGPALLLLVTVCCWGETMETMSFTICWGRYG